MKKILNCTLAVMLSALVFVACSKDGGGNGSDPFGLGGGGGGSSALVGKWSTSKLSGTATYNYTDLTEVVNSNMASFSFTADFLAFTFDANGNARLDMSGYQPSTGTYTYNGSSLVLKGSSGSMTMNTTVSGNTMTMKLNHGDGIAEAVAEALAMHVMAQSGLNWNDYSVQIQSTNLTLTLTK